jgi:predicted nucleotide-binding protein
LSEIRLAKKEFCRIQSDLLQSEKFNFENNLRTFVEFCENNKTVAKITFPLKTNQNIDIKKWHDKYVKSGRSSAQSKPSIPKSPDVEASLFYKLILGLNRGEFDLDSFASKFYNSPNYLEAFNKDICRKLIRNLNQKLDEIEQAAKQITSPLPISFSSDKKSVFVVHGRNVAARDAVCHFLRAIDLKPIEWSQAVSWTGKPSPYIGEVLDAAFSRAQAVVVLMTPDDEGKIRKGFASSIEPACETKLTPQPRLNVIFEAGFAMGRNQDRTVLVELGRLRHFSDIEGRLTLRLDNSSQKRQQFAERLQSSGCKVDLSGTDWHSAGNFAINQNRVSKIKKKQKKPFTKLH